MDNSEIIWDAARCQEELDRVMLKIAMSQYANIEGNELIEEYKTSSKPAIYSLSAVNLKLYKKKLGRILTIAQIKIVGSVMNKITTKVAMLFLAISILFYSSMTVSASFRKSIYKLIFTTEEKYTMIELSPVTEMEFVGGEQFTWDHAYAPTKLPLGYVVTHAEDSGDMAFSQYDNENSGRFLILLQNKSGVDVGTQVDTENTQMVQHVSINNSDAIFVSKDGVNTLVWRVGGTILTMNTDEDFETAISIAKGIMLIK